MKNKKNNIYLVSCLFLVIIKFWLISKNEIVAMPCDAEAYVSLAMEGLGKLGVVHSGYPLWLYITQQLGIPQRVAIEILYLASCFFVSTSTKLYTNFIAAIILFAVLVFAPFTYFLFDQALSDGFYLCLTLLAFAFSLKLLSTSDIKLKSIVLYSCGLGVVLGAMMITRAEDPLIFFWIFLVTIFFTVFCRKRDIKVLTVNFWQRPFYILLVSSIVTFLILNLTCTVIYKNSGVFARSYTLLSGHYNFLKKLAMIDSGNAQQRYIPISSKSRKLAYAVSQTLMGLREEVEKQDNDQQTASRLAGLPTGEIGAGWIWQVFLGAMFNTIPDPNPVKVEAGFKKINDELDKAFADGLLKKRFIINPLIGGNIPQLISHWPSTVSTVLWKVFSSYPYLRDKINNAQIFNEACLRRDALIKGPPHIVLQGWAFASTPHLKISSVLPRSIDGDSGKITFIDRVDVTNYYRKTNRWAPEVYGFRTDIETNSIEKARLTYILSDGTVVESNSFSKGQVSIISNKADKRDEIIQGIDIAENNETKATSGVRHRLQTTLVQIMGSKATVILSFIVSIAFLFLGAIKFIFFKQRRLRKIFVLQFTVLLLFCARIFFYTLIETASWNVEVRYLASAQALFFIYITISIVSLIGAAKDFKSLKIKL